MTAMLLLAGGVLGGTGIFVLYVTMGRGPAHLPRRWDVAENTQYGHSVDGPMGSLASVLIVRSYRTSDVELCVLGRDRRDDDRAAVVSVGSCAVVVMGVASVAMSLVAGPALGSLVAVPAGVVGGLAGIVVHRRSVAAAVAAERSRIRYELSAFLDVVVMSLAADTTVDSAIDAAASSGHGRFFDAVAHALVEQRARGGSVVDALASVADAFDMAELRQTAEAVRLAVREGAPLGKTLAARCATLRGAVAAEEETEARLRTSRLTGPLVGMGVVFMAVVIYPALGVV